MPYPKLPFYPPIEIQSAINRLADPAAGSTGLLMSAMEVTKDPLLINPPFSLRDATSSDVDGHGR